MTRKLYSFLLAVLFLAPPMFSFAAVPQFFLVQNSGWMQPYFSDKQAQFPEIMRRLVLMACHSGNEKAVLAVFNQSTNSESSPRTLYQGSCNSMPVGILVGKIHAARMQEDPQVFANSNYRQALYRAIERYAKGQSAVIWMVTNNKNSPDNSSRLSVHDADFYHMLQDSPEISRVIALPLADGATSRYFTSHGLIVFGIAYGQAAADYLHALVADGAANKYFGVDAAALKPLNVSAVSFYPEKFSGSISDVQVRSGVLNIDIPAKSVTQKFTVSGRFKNLFYPYIIESAQTKADLLLGNRVYNIPITPAKIEALDPSKYSQTVTLSFTVPPTPSWSLSTILSSGRDIPAVLRFSLAQQKLIISPAFTRIINQILPDAPMPAIFQPDAKIKSSITSIPMNIRVQYPVWPLLVLIAAVLFLLLLIGFIVYRLASAGSKTIKVRINGKVNTYRLSRGQTQMIKNEDGAVVAELRRGRFGYHLNALGKGNKVEFVKK